MKNPPINEKQFQQQVIGLAQLRGYDCIYHTWDSRNSPSGFPDLIIVRDGRQIVAELKREGENITAEQYFWLLEFMTVPETEVYVWWPTDDDWAEIEKVFENFFYRPGNEGIDYGQEIEREK